MSIKNTINTKRFQSIATEVAKRSPCVHKHGALITRGNKIFASGYNDNMRTSFLGKHDCCMHAEMSAATEFINCAVRKNKKKFCF